MPMQGQEAQAQGQDSQQGEAGSPMELINTIHKDMMLLMDMMSKSGQVPAEAKQNFNQIIQQFRSFVQSLGGAKQQPQEEGNTTQEQGSAEAIPVG